MGPIRQAGQIDVPVMHHFLDKGLSVPSLDKWFSPPYNVKSTYYTGRDNFDYKIYFQLAVGTDRVDVKSTELAVFRLDTYTNRLVDLQSGDEEFVKGAICK
jgi:hypothetical protein